MNRFIFRYSFTYYTTKEQEEELAGKISQVLDSLKLKGKSDYDKFIAIYDYIVENVDYDDRHLKDDSYKLKYTAYAAMCNGTAVCQGYATLFYAMCKYAGLEVLMVDGIAQNDDGWGEHAWNLVRIDGYWYQADPTWDSESSVMGYRYFLQGTDTFKKHRLNLDYTQDSFTSTHIMPVNSYKNSLNENPLIRLFKKIKGILLGE